MKKLVNGDGPVPQRKQRGMDEVFEPRVAPEVLRKMDHDEWLKNFAQVMKLKTGVEMTPMRAGVISRLNLAAEFIVLVKSDIRQLLKQVADQQKLLKKADEKIRELSDEEG